MKDKNRIYLKKSLWEQLKKNGCKKKNKEKMKELRRENDKEEEHKENRKWYGITSIRKYT